MKLRLSTFLLVALLSVLSISAVDAAMVRVGRLVLHADGGFTPQKLPRKTFAPISFHGFATVKATDGGLVPPLRLLRLEFDRDGRLGTKGLPTCTAEQLQVLFTAEARALCKGAIVGTGSLAAAINVPGLNGLAVRSPLTIFNGPRVNGNATAIAHAYTLVPYPEIYAVVVPIERRGGPFAYRTTFEIPPIAGGLGALTRVEAKIGRLYRAEGRKRSYVNARCSDRLLETRGRAEFEEGTVIEGTVYRGCSFRVGG